MTRDDVIYALERCTCTVTDACVDCPMWEEGQSDYIACRTRLLREALALLKEEHRPLSLDDVLQVYHTLDSHVWPHNKPPYLWCEVKRKTFCRVTWREVMDIIDGIVTLRPFSIDNYGELWTLYMTRPDKEDTNRGARMEEDHV